MKSLYESILDDEDVLMSNANNNITATAIYNKIINGEQLTKADIDLINNKVGVYEVNRDELDELIKAIKKEKRYYKLSLNWLDVSKVKNMSFIFHNSPFNGDISKWDVSNVKDMGYMFQYSDFNSDISKWDVRNVINMNRMFMQSQFNKDISKWNVSNVKDMSGMFSYSKFDRDISKWDVSKVINMSLMFKYSKFNRDISKWDVSKVKYIREMFTDCYIKEEYKPKNIE